MGAARSIIKTVATVALIAVAAPVVGAALVGGAVSATVATAVGAGVISGGLTAIQGGKTSDILKSAIIGGVVSGVGASVSASVSSSIADAAREAGFTSIADTMGKVAGSAAGSGTSSALSAAARGKDPIDALLSGGISSLLTGGVGATVASYTADIPGFSDLSKDYGAAGSAIQRAVNTGLTAGMLGKDVEASTLNSLIGSVSRTAGDFLKDGVKDLSSTVRTAYTTLTDTGNAVDKNLADQQKAADSYNTLSASLSKSYNEANDALKNYNDAKYGFENYDAKMKADGFQASTDEDGNTSYYKRVGGSYQTRDDGEGGTYQAFVPDGTYKDDEGNPVARTITAPTKDQFLNDANKYAAVANEKINSYNDAYKTGTEKLNEYKSTLTALQAEQPKLENTFVEQKKALDTTLADYTAQEKANAEYISKTINDVATAKSEIEKTLGTPVTDDQIAAFVKTGDVAAAAKDYIDLKTTDLGEAQAAALKEGYYFDPNDPELAKQFLGVKDEKDTLAALQQFADARATTVQEATDLYRQTYADIYGPDAQVPEPTQEDLLAFMPAIPTDVSSIPKNYQNVAEDVVKGRIQDQFSQDIGFDNYADRTEAQQALGETRPEADSWNQFKGTSGVVGVEGSDVTPTQFAQTGAATALKPQADANDLAQATTDQQVATNDQTADQFGFDTLGQTSQAATQPLNQQDVTQQLGLDQTASDVVGNPTLADLGVNTADVTDVTSDIPGAQTSPVQAPAVAATPLADTQLSTAPADLMAEDTGVLRPSDLGVTGNFDMANAPIDTSAVSSLLNSAQDKGVQTAAYQPSNIMSDTENVGDIGLRSLVTTQPGGTTADADTLGIASLTDRNLTQTTKPEDLQAATKGSATYSALTDADPTKTIGTSILEDKPDDIHGGVQTSGLYSGAENELGASDTLAAKYFNEPTKKQDVEDVGLTSRAGTGNDTTTYAEPRPTDELLKDTSTNADADKLDQFLSPLRTDKTTLPVSQEPARATQTNLGNKMDEEDFSIEDLINRDRDNIQNNGGGGDNQELLTPDGVNESFLSRLSPEELARYRAMQEGDYQAPDYGIQDLGISQGNIDSFNTNFNPAGGFSSGWQTVGSDRVMINDDGTGIGINTETGESYSLTPDQVQSLINNGMLNTAGSGYVAATGGTGTTPGGTGKTTTTGTDKTKTTSTTGSKVVDKVIDAITTPKVLTALAGAAAGVAGGAKGMTPMGLRSIAEGSGKQMVQTGAKGTKGHGTVNYFEKKATGGEIKGGLGYLKSAHDGMADKIDATIDNKRPAKLSGGEFVIPADVVSHLGNGNSEAGAKQLYALMERVRKARTGTADQGKQINPKKYLPR